ncbi:hypothetical protein C9I98_10325 [Photobacterium sanctipauli]|uniref:Uncharacterized protein n=1 Tax=Photobacterium sanctipauli TaxID=1342794 RepID=A0A2T3NU80_9GAMM|nr:hypothetical protein [Photobacterium sanctipauli]PSW19850.1 hypothetical protein C9I98_10325 [Photobacterium sanctipauli]
MKYNSFIALAIASSLLAGCGGESSSETKVPTTSSLQSYQTQLNVDSDDLASLKQIKYASNEGAGINTPKNFEK